MTARESLIGAGFVLVAVEGDVEYFLNQSTVRNVAHQDALGYIDVNAADRRAVAKDAIEYFNIVFTDVAPEGRTEPPAEKWMF